jgi:peptidoglycan hydrolase-like protein with peptidoglycan-binding domain
MAKVRNIAALLALSSVVVLPACSMFGGGQSSRTGAPSRSHASAQQAYPSPQSPELTQDMIRQVQERLQQDGTYRGRVDGVWGQGTEASVRSYQQQHNLNASGKLDVDTLASLNLGINHNYGSEQPGQRYGSNNPSGDTNPPPNNAYQPNTTNPPPVSNTR